jgi:hypothetical protein
MPDGRLQATLQLDICMSANPTSHEATTQLHAFLLQIACLYSRASGAAHQARLLTWREVAQMRADRITLPLKLMLSVWSGATVGGVI